MPSSDSSSSLMENNINTQKNAKGTFANEVDDQELPKEWTFEDPFQYAPSKPDGDPWTLLLEPLLKKDKMQCDAWKDEVQNLLIFAGLFSAVVTAFIVESYKTLRPDPYEAMIILLAHIATRLDSQSNSTSDPFSTFQKFSPDASSIRINVFWFISLVLSLTTVLVGIISLQWLREHQSYPDLSPRETYAIFNMRDEGMKRWHVDKIFTALPLLLQSALVLFLAGIVDFLHAFRAWAVIIPVAVVVGLTLVFLVSTTILPTLQIFSYYFFTTPKSGHHTQMPVSPGQCPYKSPQSHAMRRLCSSLFTLGYYILNHYEIRRFWRRMTRPFVRQSELLYLTDHKYLIHIYATSFHSNWIGFDGIWLLFRDTYARLALGLPTSYDFVRSSNVTTDLPVYDIITALKKQRFHSSTSAATYHCLSEISETALQRLSGPHVSFLPAELLCQNDCIFDLLNTPNKDFSILDFLDFQSYFDSAATGDLSSMKALASILHQQNLLAFTRSASVFSTHNKELALRFFRHFYQGHHQMHPSNTTSNIPQCLTLDHLWLFGSDNLNLMGADVFATLSWQVANLTLSIFRQLLDQEFHPHSLVHNPLMQNASLALYMDVAGLVALKTLSPPNPNAGHHSPSRITRATATTFHSVISHLDLQLIREMSYWSADEGQPSLLFYLAAYFTYQLTALAGPEPLTSLIGSIVKYRKCTIDIGKVDSVVEKRLRAYRQKQPYRYFDLAESRPVVFSPKWWASFDIPLGAEPSVEVG